MTVSQAWPRWALAVATAWAGVAAAADGGRVLDGFESTAAWKTVASNQVSASIRQADGVHGKAMCLDYDFNGVSGYAGVQRDLPLDYPGNYAFTFMLRGDSPANDLQFKLIDDSGDNVWWVNRPAYAFPPDWSEVRYKRRHVSKAWGPGADPVLHHSARIEFTINNHAGGKGSVCFDDLRFEPLPVDDGSPLKATASATAALAGSAAANAVDGDPGTAWRARESAVAPPALTLDLGRVREFGGLVLHWLPGAHASAYGVQLSRDGHDWRDARTVAEGNGGDDLLALPESEARYLRLVAMDGPGTGYALGEATLQPLEFAATPNAFIEALAKRSPRGWFPRGFVGEQPYWTILGVDGGRQQGLLGEDGALEVARGGFSLEPFVLVDGALATWAGADSVQSLQEGYLPIPTVEWRRPGVGLRVTAFAQGGPDSSRLVARYVLANTGDDARDFTLALALRPFQVNPPSQFLNTAGGVSPIHRLEFTGDAALVDGKRRVDLPSPPDAAFAAAFDAGMSVEHLARGDAPGARSADDPQGLASGAVLYRWRLAPGESREIDVVVPMTGESGIPAGFDAAAAQRAVAGEWSARLDRVGFRVPPQGQDVVDTLRSALAQMLMSREGPRLRPGTRSYARSWIRDGAMIAEGLLRMGRGDVARDFVEWYAPYQFDNGKVPCCVDDRGSDPVPENDSQGELVYAVAEVYRYTHDRDFLARMWPHVAGAVRYMDELRASQRTAAIREATPELYGLMPASISHEGYSAKPMHSYWDDFWALRGYKDAVDIARWLGRDADARAMAASRDQFHGDLLASIAATARARDIDFIPGAAELGDFDPTSTTIALAPGGEQDRLPKPLLEATFERYWREFVARRDGTREWDKYTPYELRNVGAFVRLGWRGRVVPALDFFFAGRTPQAWNQWAEVVSRTPRTPFFVGDLPHAWVASDYVRSALDMFAYGREDDDALVLAAGIPPAWLDGDGIAVHGLRTPHGTLGYSLRRDGGVLRLRIDPGSGVPPGGFVLPWPYPGRPGKARVDGAPAAWTHGELRIRALPGAADIAAGRATE